MDYEQRVTELMKEAMRAKDPVRLDALRAIKSALLVERTRDASPMTEDRAVKAIAAHRKKMQNAAGQFHDAGRQDLAESAEKEAAVCDELLPRRLGDDDLRRLIDETIAETGAASPQEMGRVMGPVMKKVAGRADGNEVRRLVAERLGAGQ